MIGLWIQKITQSIFHSDNDLFIETFFLKNYKHKKKQKAIKTKNFKQSFALIMTFL